MSFRASDFHASEGAGGRQHQQPRRGPPQRTACAAAADEREPVRHVVSLGCRCSQAATFKVLRQRRYACPFDWIFSSAGMIVHCLRDDFATFLDRSQYFLAATLFDAIGLPPGSAPRDRNVIGHHVYSDMTEGVGRGSIFNHRDPLHNDDDYAYTERTAERLRCVLASADRKLFAMMNLNRQLWIEADIRELFDELCARTKNFTLVAVNCIRNQGASAWEAPAQEVGREERGNSQLLVYSMPCVGENTGSYFREDCDAAKIRTILVDPFKFRLADDPLPDGVVRPAVLPQEKQAAKQVQKLDSFQSKCQEQEQQEQRQQQQQEQQQEQQLKSRWSRSQLAQSGGQAPDPEQAPTRRWRSRHAQSA